MDMLDQALESSHQEKVEDSTSDDHCVADGGDEQGTIVAGPGGLTIDPNIQYQIRADTGQAGQVTYRVVQVTQNEEGETQVMTASPFPPDTQAIMQSPFSNGGSPTADSLTETRFTYVPAVTAGQFYVMMSPQDVLQGGQRTIAPRTGIAPRIEGTRSTRDDRRRATHNEVERRRRDKINNWIVQLSKLVPDCSIDLSKQGQISKSKGGILAKACDYITELRTANTRMAESLKETERLSVDAELLRQQCEELKQENAMLHAQLQQHGIVPPDLTSTVS
ncbi:hypothetical protein NP493_657g01010 [Ridgeia piscesae]|uniref:BHLH domain-containing protein n=1 Tax=Ridgeia piscesae TaxID=27915 RepID=A0AAD9KSJ1_RIDPI|nr:hypothetical protein NP493_657g01010 [Ridgeia piscesae]